MFGAPLRPSRIRRGVAGFVATLIAAGFSVVAPSASASTPIPPAPKALRSIEAFAAYVPADSCDPVAKVGTTALGSLLTKTYPGTIYYTVRPCDASVSEHYQGRAVDWMVSVKNAAQYADANAVLKWLFATDSYGNTYANLRRLGVMYIVFNNRIWGSWDRAWQPYQNCANEPSSAYDNACHRTHIHLSLSWEGANKRTSYWTNQAVPTDYGPCKSPTLNWAGLPLAPRATPCPTHRTLIAPAFTSTLYKQVFPWSGARAVYGNTGPVVVAVQRVLGVSADGDFGQKTVAALKSWQTKHHIPANGTADEVTWHTMLNAI